MKNHAERQKKIYKAWIDAKTKNPEYSSVENYIRWLRGDNLESDEHE